MKKKYPTLYKLISNLWDGDVTFEEAVEGFTDADIKQMEECIEENDDIYEGGEGMREKDDEEYMEFLEGNEAAKKIQRMIDIQEG